MSLHFVAELEEIENEINPDFDDEPQDKEPTGAK
jgi:hypothetical protein